MALSTDDLSSALMELTRSFPATHEEAGKRWAAAYGSYAQAAQTVTGGAPTTIPAAQALLADFLGAAFASGGNAGDMMGPAFVAFWMAPPMAFMGSKAGLATGAGAPPDLAGVFSGNISNRVSAQEACDAIAAELHRFTVTVVCTEPTPLPLTAGPIS